MTENVVSRGFTRVKFVDQYGDERVIHRSGGGSALRIKKKQDSVSHLLNRAAAEIIGDRIKQYRMAAGLSLEELLLKAGLTSAPGSAKARMWEIENAGRGHRQKQSQGIRFGTLYAIAMALDCSVADLLPTNDAVAKRAGVTMAVPETPRLASQTLQAAA